MAWRGSTDLKDRLFGAIVYLFAVYDVMALGIGLFTQIPALLPLFQLLQVLLAPIQLIYSIFNTAIPLGLGSLVVFFILFLAVVRNDKISYFIRFNTMQSILIGIAISLIQIVFGTMGGLGLIGGLVFIVVVSVCFYCMAQCFLGRYPEIPSFSEIVYMYVQR